MKNRIPSIKLKTHVDYGALYDLVLGKAKSYFANLDHSPLKKEGILLSDQPTSVKLLKLLAKKRHLKPHHSKRPAIEEQIARYSSGYYGEVSIDFHLKYILEMFPKLSNLRLKLNGIFFEIDTLLFCEKFLLLLQVKNLTGTITIDHQVGTMNQKVRDEEIGYQDPILQVEKHARLLSFWLKNKGYSIPIETLVIFTNKNVIIQRGTQPLDKRIISGFKLSHAYYELKSEYRNKPSIPNRSQIYQELHQNNEIYDINLLEEFELDSEDFSTGGVCNQCFRKTMEYQRTYFVCSHCHNKSNTTLEESLKDYYLIFGRDITSEDLSQWVNLDPLTARRFLTKLNLDTTGGRRFRIYRLNFDYRTDFKYLLDYNKKTYLNKIK